MDRCPAGGRQAHVLAQDAARPHGDGAVENDHARNSAKRPAYLVNRPRPVAGHAEGADRDTLVAQLVDDVGERAQHRAQGDDDHLGVGGAVGPQEAARVAPERLGEVVGDLADDVEGAELAVRHQVLHLGVGLRPHHRPDRDRLVRVEPLPRLERREVGVDLVLSRYVDLLHRMGQHEAVHADHHRQGEPLGQGEGLHVQVDGLLVGRREQHQPSGVALGERVGVVVPDVDRRAQCTVGHGHHHRQTESRRVGQCLGHEEQSLARGSRVGAGTGSRSADARRERAELGLDHQVLARSQLPGGDQVGERLHDVGLRGDRVRRHDMRAAPGHGLGDRTRTLQLPKHGFHSPASGS